MAPRTRNYEGGHTGECRGSAARAHGRGRSGEPSLKSAALTSPFPTALPSLGGYIRAGETNEEIPHKRKAVPSKIPAMSAICPVFFSSVRVFSRCSAPSSCSLSLSHSLASSFSPPSLSPSGFFGCEADRRQRRAHHSQEEAGLLRAL